MFGFLNRNPATNMKPVNHDVVLLEMLMSIVAVAKRRHDFRAGKNEETLRQDLNAAGRSKEKILAAFTANFVKRPLRDSKFQAHLVPWACFA